MATERLEIILTATDRASAQLRGVMGTLGRLAIQAVSTAAVWSAMRQAFDMAEEGASLMRLRDAGTAMAAGFGESMADVVQSIRDAALGGISELDALGAASRAMALGVSTDAETLGQLMEVAAIRGRIMGLSTTQAFNDIVTGIGRMSPMILDNLGILTTDLPAGLTGAARRAALLNMVLQDGPRLLQQTGGLGRDAATSFERLGASSEDAGNRLKMALAEAFAPFADWLADVIEAENEYARSQEQTRDIIAEFNLRIGERNSYLDEEGNLVARGRDQLLAYAEAQRAAADGTEAASGALDGAAGAAQRFATNLSPVPSIFDSINTSIGSTIATWMGEIEFLAGGGAEIQQAAEATRQALLAGAITPEDAQQIFGNLLLEADRLQVELGDATPWELARQHADEFGVPIGEAYRNITGISDTIRELPSQHVVEIIFQYQNAPPGFGTASGVVGVLPTSQGVPVGAQGGGGDSWQFEQDLMRALRGMG